MNNIALTEKMISLLDWNISSTSFHDSLIPENCYCPSIAKSTQPDKSNAIQDIRRYYNILYLLVDAIVSNEPTLVCGGLYSLKQYLDDYQLKLTDFIYKGDVFHGMEIYYTETEPHNGSFQCWAFHCEGGNHPKEIRDHYNLEYVDIFKDPESYYIPVFLRSLKFIHLTKNCDLDDILTKMLYPLVDQQAKELLDYAKWDEIDFHKQRIFIVRRLHVIPKQENNLSEVQQKIPDVSNFEKTIKFKAEGKEALSIEKFELPTYNNRIEGTAINRAFYYRCPKGCDFKIFSPGCCVYHKVELSKEPDTKEIAKHLGLYYYFKIATIYSEQIENKQFIEAVESVRCEFQTALELIKDGYYLAGCIHCTEDVRGLLQNLEDSFRQSRSITELFNCVTPLVSLSKNAQAWLNLFWQLVNMTAIYRQKILLPDYKLSDQEKGLLHFLITSKEELKVIPINNPANENGKDPFNDTDYWQAIRDKLKSTVRQNEASVVSDLPSKNSNDTLSQKDDSNYKLEDYYFGVPESDYSKTFNSLFLKAKTPQDVIGLLYILCFDFSSEVYEICHCTNDDLKIEAEKLIDWANENLKHVPEAASDMIFKYNILLFHQNRASFDQHFRNIFNGLLDTDYTDLGIDKNPFKVLVYGDLNNITPLVCSSCCTIFRFNESETSNVKISKNRMAESEGQQVIPKPEKGQQLKKYDNFDFINRIEVDGLKFTIYYGDYKPDTILPNTFPGCMQYSKPSQRWDSIINTLLDKRPILDRKDRLNINKSFKEFFHNKGIECPNIIGKDKKYQVKNISAKSHGDSYRKEQGRRYKFDQSDENDDY